MKSVKQFIFCITIAKYQKFLRQFYQAIITMGVHIYGKEFVAITESKSIRITRTI